MMTDHQDYPPVALGQLDDKRGWRWLSPRPVGAFDWLLTVIVVALGIVPVLVLMPLCWALRTITRKVGA